MRFVVSKIQAFFKVLKLKYPKAAPAARIVSKALNCVIILFDNLLPPCANFFVWRFRYAADSCLYYIDYSVAAVKLHH